MVRKRFERATFMALIHLHYTMHRKYHALLYLFLGLYSCKEDDRLNECYLIDCIAQTFSIELVDSDGVNLITNETYILDNIVIAKNNQQLNLNQIATDDTVYFFVSGKNGNNTYTIKLNETEKDELVLNLTRIKLELECCGPYFRINSANYNGTEVEIIDDDNFNFEKIIILKP